MESAWYDVAVSFVGIPMVAPIDGRAHGKFFQESDLTEIGTAVIKLSAALAKHNIKLVRFDVKDIGK